MKLLFIGGTGNLSADCAALLHRRGHEIMVLTRGHSEVSAEYRRVVADRRDGRAFRAALDGNMPEVVINFLGYELEDVRVDFEIFGSGLRQYLFISSATVYKKPAPLPITESAPLGNAFWDYAQKKLACERWLLERYKESGFPVTIVRPSHTYSHRWIPNPVSSGSYTFAARLETGKPVWVPDDGENPWTLTAASDFAVGLAGLVGHTEAIGEAVHITSDEALSWNRIYQEIASALGGRAPSTPVIKVPTEFICQVSPEFIGNLKGDKSHPGVFDNSKIKRLVPDFVCRKSFAQGVRESVEWLRAHPAQQNLRPELDAGIEKVLAAWAASGSTRPI